MCLQLYFQQHILDYLICHFGINLFFNKLKASPILCDSLGLSLLIPTFFLLLVFGIACLMDNPILFLNKSTSVTITLTF